MGKKFFQTLSARKFEPLVVTAVTDNVSFCIKHSEQMLEDERPSLLHRIRRGGSWGNVARYATNSVIALNQGDEIQIWNQSAVFSINEEKYLSFGEDGGLGSSSSASRMAISGNLMALVNWRSDLPEYSFYRLFFDCPLLLEAPEIPDVPMEDNALRKAFCFCKHLRSIRVNFKEWSEATAYWVEGMAHGGTFYKPSALPNVSGASSIPIYWDSVNID